MSGEGELLLPVRQGSSLGDFGFLFFLKPAVLFIMV